MNVEELNKRDLKRNPLMVMDNNLEKFKNYPIPLHKIDYANEITQIENFKAIKKERTTKP